MLKRITLCAIVAIAMSSVASAIPIEFFLPMDHNDLPLALRPFGNEGDVSSFYGLSFDGNDYALTANCALEAADGTEISVFVWLKPASAGYLGVVYHGHYPWNDTSPDSWVIMMDRVVVYSADYATSGDRKIYFPSSAYEVGEWAHVGFTWAGGTLRLWKNGADNTGTKLIDSTFSATNYAATKLVLGRGDANYLPYTGEMCQVYAYPYALTQAQIQELMIGIAPPGAAATYTMQPGKGQVVLDESDNGHDMQLGSTAGEDPNDPAWPARYKKLTTGGPQ